MKLAIMVIAILFCQTSCLTLRDSGLDKTRRQQVVQEHLNVLDGLYDNKCNTHPNNKMSSLWENLFANTNHIDGWQHAQVSLSANDSRQLLVASLLVGDSIVLRRTVKLKVQRGFAGLKRQSVTRSVAGPLLWGISDWKVFLCPTSNNNLYLARASTGSAMFLVVPVFPAGGQVAYEYSRVK